MPILMGTKEMPLSPTGASKEFKKPIGVKVIIRRITVHSVYNVSFGRWHAYLFDPSSTFAGAEFMKIIHPGGDGFKLLWEGSVDWPEGWILHLDGTNQTASDVFTYIISYDVAPPIKKGWGQ